LGKVDVDPSSLGKRLRVSFSFTHKREKVISEKVAVVESVLFPLFDFDFDSEIDVIYSLRLCTHVMIAFIHAHIDQIII